jgi:hypothetical protein
MRNANRWLAVPTLASISRVSAASRRSRRAGVGREPPAAVGASLQRLLVVPATGDDRALAAEALHVDRLELRRLDPAGRFVGRARRGALVGAHEAAHGAAAGFGARPGDGGTLARRPADRRENEQLADVAAGRQHRSDASVGEVELPTVGVGGREGDAVARGGVGGEPHGAGDAVDLGLDQQVAADGRRQADQFGDLRQPHATLGDGSLGQPGEQGHDQEAVVHRHLGRMRAC